MIPKRIHYCWFGGKPLPQAAARCLNSWKTYLPDYEIIEWNEQNFDVNLNDYTKFCYEHKLWAYLSDYVRLWVVEKYGGFYFDTDVELIKSPVTILDECDAFYGWESDSFVNTGLGFASVAHHSLLLAMLESYEAESTNLLECHFKTNNSLIGCPRRNTHSLVSVGLKQNGERQKLLGALFLPVDFLCPYNDLTGELKKTSNTISIHWFNKSPQGKWAILRNRLMRPVRRFLFKL